MIKNYNLESRKCYNIARKHAFVYVIENQKALKKNIEIGRRNFGKVSVLNGINEGDIVISEGISKVRDQSKVKVIEK